MAEVTPRKMLTEFQRQSDDFTRGQAEHFVMMSAAERMELLFYMAVHNNKILQHVHGLIDSEAAETKGIEDIETPTQ